MVMSTSKHDVEEEDTAPSPHAEGGVEDGRLVEPLCAPLVVVALHGAVEPLRAVARLVPSGASPLLRRRPCRTSPLTDSYSVSSHVDSSSRRPPPPPRPAASRQATPRCCRCSRHLLTYLLSQSVSQSRSRRRDPVLEWERRPPARYRSHTHPDRERRSRREPGSAVSRETESLSKPSLRSLVHYSYNGQKVDSKISAD